LSTPAQQAWYQRNKERIAAERQVLKCSVLAKYGGLCACCGETDFAFLTIDHIHNDGGEDRRRVRASGNAFYRRLVDAPKRDDLQVLCFNCNYAKNLNGGTCPHGGSVVYIGGPMRYHDRYNFPAFFAAAARLRTKGWRVLSPAEHDKQCGFDETKNSLDGFDLKAAFRWDVEAILRSDAIYLLTGWQNSEGANLERQIAEAIGIEVLYEDDDPAPVPISVAA
jgi:hypothetical protein